MSEAVTGYVREVCLGSTEALAKLYTMTLRPSYYLALKLCGNGQDAVEVTKKAYAKAFCTITKLKKPEAFEIWVRQNITTVYKDSVDFTFEDADSQGAETAKEFLSPDVYTSPAKGAAALRALDSLRPELRMITVLHYYVNMPVRSIAKFLNVSESTVNALLAKAKGEIFSLSGSSQPEAVPVSGVPVLSSLMQDEMSRTEIDSSDIREMFVYIQDIFETFKNSERAQNLSVDGKAENEYFSAPGRTEPSVPVRRAPAPSEIDESETTGQVDFDRFNDEPPAQKPAQTGFAGFIAKVLNTRVGGKKIKDYDLKKIGVIALAVIVALIVIIAIGKHTGKKEESANESVVSGSVTAQVKENDYKWVDTGFEECSEILFLDNNAAVFKSTVTNKYGLIDYKGNVILQPIYDGFKRCSEGREYAQENVSAGVSAYHTLYTLDGTDYYVYYEGGVAIASNNPHIKHSYTPAYLDSSLKYDERDRYYEGLAAAQKDGKWGYVSIDNDKKVIPYEYEAVNDLDSVASYSCDYCRPFTNGLAGVKKDGMMGIINTKNDVIVPFEYSDILVGSDGVFIAKKDGKWGVILIGSAINTFTGVNIHVDAQAIDDPVANEENAKTYICVADSGINVRSDAGAEFQKIGELESGREVIGYGTKTAADSGKEWLKIKYEDGYGYVAMSYMKEK